MFKFSTWFGRGATALALVASLAPVSAQTCIEQQKLSDPEPSLQALFGVDLALDGDTLVVGSPSDDAFGEGVGSASVFGRDPETGLWSFEQKLVGSEVFQLDGLGLSVALEGDLLAIGGQGLGPFGIPGSVYVFRRDGGGGWVEEAKLGDEVSQFSVWGSRLEICDGRLFVGNPSGGNMNVPGDPVGNLDVFEEVAPGVWEATQRIAPRVELLERGITFAEQFSCLGDRLVVGAPSSEIAPFSSKGAAFVFDRGEDGVWRQTQELFFDESPISLLASFGSSVLLREDRLYVGDSFRISGGFQPGRVYVYEEIVGGRYELVQRFEGSRAQNNDRFGTALAEDDGILLVGTPFFDLGGNDSVGAVYGFTEDAGVYSERGVLRQVDAGAFDALGSVIEFEGDVIVAGANNADAGGAIDAGAAFAFTFVPCTE